MKTKAIKRCIDSGSDVRDALAAQEELYAIEAEFEKFRKIEWLELPGSKGTMRCGLCGAYQEDGHEPSCCFAQRLTFE